LWEYATVRQFFHWTMQSRDYAHGIGREGQRTKREEHIKTRIIHSFAFPLSQEIILFFLNIWPFRSNIKLIPSHHHLAINLTIVQ
jgi:hypothetical protein